MSPKRKTASKKAARKKGGGFWRLCVFLLILALIVLAFALLSTQGLFRWAEPSVADYSRGGVVLNKLYRQAIQAKSDREIAVIGLSPDEIDSILELAQSAGNPYLRKEFSSEGLPFRVVRRGDRLDGTYVLSLPLPGVFLRLSGEFTPSIGEKTGIGVKLESARAGALPLPLDFLNGQLRRQLADHAADLAKLRAVIVDLAILPDGGWIVRYRPYRLKTLILPR